jgi:putative salt-induced outer membrane protein YdiY
MYKKIIFALSILLSIFTLCPASQFTSCNVEKKYFLKSELAVDKKLKQNLRFGFSNTTGNAETMYLNGKYALSFAQSGYRNLPLKFSLLSSAYFSKGKNKKRSEEYLIDLGLEQVVYKEWLGYMFARWLKSPHIRHFNHKLSANIGVGRKLLNNEDYLLKIKFGIAHNTENYSSNKATNRYESMNEYIEYTSKVNENSHLNVKFGAMQNLSNLSEDYEMLGVVGFDFTISKNINLTVEEEFHYDAIPTDRLEKINTKSLMSLGYLF